MSLVSALEADEGVTCFVGAGGKKSTIYKLATELPRAIVTNTVRIPLFDEHVDQVSLKTDPSSAIQDIDIRPLGLVAGKEGTDRYTGYQPETIDKLAASTSDPILVKADGARMRRFKAPGDNEPQLPSSTDTVVPIVSIHVIGQPLDDRLVHRVDRVSQLTGLSLGDTITPEAVATVITSRDGGRKAVPDEATVIPLINMVDTPEYCAQAAEVAEEMHAKAQLDRVVLARMNTDSPVVSIC